ncbi:Tm-1-like ATP-binding domain-containing protein [Thalassoglobus sp. JC818]|uniref:Tm-1-like ATP-binding domain-containing protein n=1 Tax=Thalassoglobus sp. JC818 TaxID=3232136 RepID=UPI00345839D6
MNSQRESAAVYLLATMDTKGAELGFLADRLRHRGVAVRTVDVGTDPELTAEADVSREEVLAASAIQSTVTQNESTSGDRGQAIAKMSACLREFMLSEQRAGRVQGVIGIGGSGGTSLIAPAMRILPIGMPKILVSTVASGNVAPYVDCSDIFMLYSVVDIAGLNVVSKRILTNAADAMAGMVLPDSKATTSKTTDSQVPPRNTVGLTMFGVTTPCVTQVRQQLEADNNECLVFHATGTGGRAMEQLVESGFLTAVMDITTTEVADEIVGGVFAAGPERFDRVLRSRVPYILSLGALDMVNFGARETVPPQFQDRLLHCHNAQVTLMRTNAVECKQIGRWIADKLNQSVAPLRLLIPEGGLSLLDVPGQPFHDPEADHALFDSLEEHLQQSDTRQCIRLPYEINAPEFSEALLQHFSELSAKASS